MTEPDVTPDPVRATAPDAPPAPDEDVDTERGAVFPVAGTGAGTVLPPVAPPRTG